MPEHHLGRAGPVGMPRHVTNRSTWSSSNEVYDQALRLPPSWPRWVALTFIPFLAALVLVIWRAGQETLAIAVGISGGVFVAMGFVSNAAETALMGWPTATNPAVLALDQLQGRTPIVWSITALVAVLSLAIQRTGLIWRWLGVVGLVAAAIFLLGSVFSVLGRTPRGVPRLSGRASSSSGCWS
jgi:hypothetical protein